MLLSIARLLDDARKFEAVVRGTDSKDPVVLSWVRYFDHVIFGQADHPTDCYPNTGPDGPSSQTAFTTAEVSPGEVMDRYRNGNTGQGIGYPMFTFQRLLNAAEVMRLAGFDPYGYQGRHRQSLEMAIAYYACFAKSTGFMKVVTRENAGACPNASQYYGKIVNGVDSNVVIGAYRFPQNVRSPTWRRLPRFPRRRDYSRSTRFSSADGEVDEEPVFPVPVHRWTLSRLPPLQHERRFRAIALRPLIL